MSQSTTQAGLRISSGAPALGAIVGPARSGTTWAGALIDSSPHVIYRFEPFHRQAFGSADFRDWFNRLKAGAVKEADLSGIYSLLLPANPLTNKPPFFEHKAYSVRHIGKDQMWPLARSLPFLRKTYESLYTPVEGPPLIFKEVTFIKPLLNLLAKTLMPIVYVVRHPCATVLSDAGGQAAGRMPSGRQENLSEILNTFSPELADRFGEVLSGTDVVARTALLWRCEVETCVSAVRKSSTAMVVTYEELAEDAHVGSARMFAHFGLEMTSETGNFVDQLYDMGEGGRKRNPRTGWGHHYFGVFRNPRQQKEAWKERVTARDRAKIESIVEDSPVVEYCARLGKW